MQKKSTLFLTLLVTSSLVSIASCGTPVDSSGQGSASDSMGIEEEYVVKFNSNYDGSVIRVTVKAGNTVTLPQTPSRPGYVFGGWYLDYRGEQAFDASSPINKNLTLYAKWTESTTQHVVIFHFQDRKTPDLTVPVEDGKTVSLPANPVYPDGTMQFVGWYLDVQRTTSFDASSPIRSNLDVYAGWSMSKATVIFNYNYTGSPEASRVAVELDVPMAEPTAPTREHYAFLGWFTKALGGEKFDFTKPVTGNMTLYAQWEESEFLVTFDLNGGTLAQGAVNSVYIAKGTSAASYAAELAEKLGYTGHDFRGWYDQKLDADADNDATSGVTAADLSSISAARTVYAGWALSVYTVSFDLNYDGATSIPEPQLVKYGKTAVAPSNPARDGYIFSGWYLDKDCTKPFTFDMPITGNTTLYTLWLEEGGVQTDVTVTYYTGSTVYATKTVAFNSPASSNAPDDPTKANAIFAGWYADADFSTKFNLNANLVQNATVYAKFLNRHTFEAEATNLNGKVGMGTSTNSFEESMIYNYEYVGDGKKGNVSNDYFIRELYYNGAFLDFEIESDKAVDDVTMYLRVSSEHDKFHSHPTVDGVEKNYLSKEEFKIVVNGDYDAEGAPTSWLDYGGLYMPMANLVAVEDLSPEKTPFEDCFISSTISLNEGSNLITLYVDNFWSHGGTFQAEAPMIDCMYLYSDANLTMYDYEYYLRPNVNKLNN